jgi:hypothetical protein
MQINFSIEEIGASEQYFDHTGIHVANSMTNGLYSTIT